MISDASAIEYASGAGNERDEIMHFIWSLQGPIWLYRRKEGGFIEESGKSSWWQHKNSDEKQDETTLTEYLKTMDTSKLVVRGQKNNTLRRRRCGEVVAKTIGKVG